MKVQGYQILHELSDCESYKLYRARRIADHRPVILKLPRQEPPGHLDWKLFEGEYSLLRSLSIAGIARAYDLLRGDNGCCLVLQDPGGKAVRSLLAFGPLGQAQFLVVATHLAMILTELHRREIIHGNINPAGMLVHSGSGEVWLCDMRLASRYSSESQPRLPQSLVTDELAYISPEQTGRMNRVTDYRTDFYSLGVTLYELLTGISPFKSADPLEVIHAHIAKTPPTPAQIDPNISEPVSEIIMKLLSKNPEHRYQSGSGLREDFEACAKDWVAHGRIAPFTLGQCDVSDHFVISRQLYGRDREVEGLLGAFDRVCEGDTSVMLVSGYAGIGKTSLIQELYKPIIRRRGYFIAGKFDQIARSIPFGALIQAFRGLIHQLLTESEDRLSGWRARLQSALGANGGVLAEVIPEIELIIGQQPPALSLSPTEALNRFQLVFQNFVGALARPEHPLVIFLDDLQWADSATLSLFGPLLTSPDIRCLFLMGAYRDNEVYPRHPLLRTLESVERSGVELHRVDLGPLRLPDLTLLIRDTLHGEASDAEPLARLVLEKTGGNPFFVTQFLETLRQEGFLEFDYQQGRWTYQLEAIAGAPLTDNVIDLMTRKLQRLSPETQHAMTLAACIGSPFDPNTLSIVSEQTQEDACSKLEEALSEGLILPAAGHDEAEEANNAQVSTAQNYIFLHDRVQQAAYAMIPPEKQQLVHLTVGRLLLERADLEFSEEKLFDIVHHLNFGGSLIVEPAECLAVALINLRAGRKAKSSTAYEAALDYLRAGLSLLTDARWESDYELAFALHLETAECFYLCGDYDEAEEMFELLLSRSKTNLDKARVYRLRSVQYENMSRYADALAVARKSLGLFGVSFPDSADEKQAALDTEIESIQSFLGQRRIESLIDLPVMTDPEIRMVMNILTDIWSSAYIVGDPVLARLISATMVRLSLVNGNVEESAYGYVTHAITVGPVRQDYDAAYEFGRLALRVNELFNDSKRRAKIHQQFHAHVNLWRQPMQTCIPYAREACRSGLETGDFLYAAYGACTETWPAIVSTQDLAQFVRDYSPNIVLIKKLKITSFADALKIMVNWARALRGETRSPLSLSDEGFDEQVYAETYRDNPFFTTFYAVARLHLLYNFGEYSSALEAARKASETVFQLAGTIWPVMFDFWNSLTLAANYGDASPDERRTYLAEMEKAQRSFAVLAESCPENFLCQSLILSAEIERISGRQASALDLFEQAIHYAGKTGILQHKALANELYGRLWLTRGSEQGAAVFMAEARACYVQWGATKKAEDLDQKHGELLERHRRLQPRSEIQTVAGGTDSLDVATAIKAAQAIAREIDLETLLSRLVSIAVENAGAERGSLVLEREGHGFVQAEGTMDSVEVMLQAPVPLDRAAGLSKGIVNYARRTLENVVLADARSDDRYAADEYIVRQQPRSILCVPILKHGRLIGRSGTIAAPTPVRNRLHDRPSRKRDRDDPCSGGHYSYHQSHIHDAQTLCDRPGQWNT